MQDLKVGVFIVFWEGETPLQVRKHAFVREQITDGSLQLPLLGVIKKKKDFEEKIIKVLKYDNPTLEVWNLGSPYFNICSKYKDLGWDLWERGNPGLSGGSETTIRSLEDLGTNYKLIPVISHSFPLRLSAGRVTTPYPPSLPQREGWGSCRESRAKEMSVEKPWSHVTSHTGMAFVPFLATQRKLWGMMSHSVRCERPVSGREKSFTLKKVLLPKHSR